MRCEGISLRFGCTMARRRGKISKWVRVRVLSETDNSSAEAIRRALDAIRHEVLGPVRRDQKEPDVPGISGGLLKSRKVVLDRHLDAKEKEAKERKKGRVKKRVVDLGDIDIGVWRQWERFSVLEGCVKASFLARRRGQFAEWAIRLTDRQLKCLEEARDVLRESLGLSVEMDEVVDGLLSGPMRVAPVREEREGTTVRLTRETREALEALRQRLAKKCERDVQTSEAVQAALDNFMKGSIGRRKKALRKRAEEYWNSTTKEPVSVNLRRRPMKQGGWRLIATDAKLKEHTQPSDGDSVGRVSRSFIVDTAIFFYRPRIPQRKQNSSHPNRTSQNRGHA